MTTRVQDLKYRAVHASKGERGWAAQQLLSLRYKIADAVQVVHYLSDKRRTPPQDRRTRQPLPADNIETLTVAKELQLPDGNTEWFIPGQTVHTQGCPGHERVVDFYRITAVVNEKKKLDHWIKFWWDNAVAQWQLSTLRMENADLREDFAEFYDRLRDFQPEGLDPEDLHNVIGEYSNILSRFDIDVKDNYDYG
jgi:hypothetical protein